MNSTKLTADTYEDLKVILQDNSSQQMGHFHKIGLEMSDVFKLTVVVIDGNWYNCAEFIPVNCNWVWTEELGHLYTGKNSIQHKTRLQS